MDNYSYNNVDMVELDVCINLKTVNCSNKIDQLFACLFQHLVEKVWQSNLV